VIKLEISKAVNIAVGCVMASGMEMKEKQEVIESLRVLEEGEEATFIYQLLDDEGELDQVEAECLEEAVEYFGDNHQGKFTIEWENGKLIVILI
jgi:hypothetical protein